MHDVVIICLVLLLNDNQRRFALSILFNLLVIFTWCLGDVRVACNSCPSRPCLITDRSNESKFFRMKDSNEFLCPWCSLSQNLLHTDWLLAFPNRPSSNSFRAIALFLRRCSDHSSAICLCLSVFSWARASLSWTFAPRWRCLLLSLMTEENRWCLWYW